MAELNSQSTSIQTLYSWYRQGRLYVNRRYQRKLVWTLEEKQKLIDSILNKYPIPAVLVAERESTGTYEIIDGLQRIHAIISFIENTFPTQDGRYFNLQHFPTALSAGEEGEFTPAEDVDLLMSDEVSVILDYTLAMSVMRGASDAEVNDVFDRINTYGHRLSDQERRQAGVQNDFANLIREVACAIRGDVSDDDLPLRSMPGISIDLPMTKHGYEVRANEVFWVREGILRSTELRDSLDEQCIADIASCVIGGQLLERSKSALDEIYLTGSSEAERISAALEVYGAEKFAQEFKFCVTEIEKCCAPENAKLRDIIYEQRTTNSFPSLFALVFIAFHELIINEGKAISDYSCVAESLKNITGRLDTSRRSTSPEERRRNVDTIKALIRDCFVEKDIKEQIYSHYSSVEIDNLIRRSEIEQSNYELKQGLLNLDQDRRLNESLVDRLLETICAIANCGYRRGGKLILGVADSDDDVKRIEQMDGIDALRVGRKAVVGVRREAEVLGEAMEDYFNLVVNKIRQSALSEPLKADVLSNIQFDEYFGLGVLVISIPAQSELSFLDDEAFYREGNSTHKAEGGKAVADLSKRFL